MKNPVLSYKEFTDQKRLTESKNNTGTPLNESFLDAVLRFFRGIFDLFGNKKLKRNYEDTRVYYKKIEYDKNLSNDEIVEELDTKKIRTSFNKATKMIGDGIEMDKEKGIRVAADLQKHLASWIAQIIALNEAMYLGIIQKMLTNSETIKKFTWVPVKYMGNSKEWYKQKECVLDKKIKESLLKILAAPQEKQENLIKDFCKRYTEYAAMQVNKDNGIKLLKANDKDILDDIHDGFVTMCINLNSAMNALIKNTNDDKLAEKVGEEIVKAREKRIGKESKKPESKDPNKTDTEEDTVKDDSRPGRSRKAQKVKKIKKDDKPENGVNTGTPSSNVNNTAEKPAEKPATTADNTQTTN